MTDAASSFTESQQTLSNALFRLWMQPLELTQAAMATGAELILRAGDMPAPDQAAPTSTLPATLETFRDAEEHMAHLDAELDRTVPGPAGIVA